MNPVDVETALPAPLERWRDDCLAATQFECEAITFAESEEWECSDETLRHRSGRYFSVAGLCAAGIDAPAAQPIILQPEVGILGFLFAHRDGELQVLVQAKVEPGNVGTLQFSPTVQATLSNYQRVHGGEPTRYLEYFLQPQALGAVVVSDSLQSEQGSRFLGKYNRNQCVLAPDAGPMAVEPLWRWVPVAEFLPLLAQSYQVNTDARSTLACGIWSLLEPGEEQSATELGSRLWASLRSESAGMSNAEQCLAEIRKGQRWQADVVPLDQLPGWQRDAWRIRGDATSEFDIAMWRVQALGREVPRWSQPLLRTLGEGLACLLCQQREGELRVLVRAVTEIGYRERCQFGPSLQLSAQQLEHPDAQQLELLQLVAAARPLAGALQSDEGGRFYHSVANYTVAELPADLIFDTPELGYWLTLAQLRVLLARQGALTNEVRSCVSLLLPLMMA